LHTTTRASKFSELTGQIADLERSTWANQSSLRTSHAEPVADAIDRIQSVSILIVREDRFFVGKGDNQR
jgi:hypothetical protein